MSTRDSNTAVYFDIASLNRVDLADKIYQEGMHEPNAKFIWTPNVGVYGIDSVRDDFYRPLALQEFEVILSELLQKKVKISIADQ